MNRPTWEEYFLEIAQSVAKRSTCSRAQVGAVFVRDNRILTCGYNGSPSGTRHCNHSPRQFNNIKGEEIYNDVLYNHCVIAIHAELNAILQGAILGISLKDSYLYCTHEPCLDCTRAIIQIGCLGIKWIHEKEDVRARELRRQVFSIEI